MLYFDYAATSFPKPEQVKKACIRAMSEAGNPGRGSHGPALKGLEVLYEAREAVRRLLGARDGSCIFFAPNATTALNEAIAQIKGHIVTTVMEHNSVLRPCFARGNVTYVDAFSGRLTAEAVTEAITPETEAVIMSHASNLTGEIYDIAAVGKVCRERGVILIVDAAQTAGCVPINVREMNIDMLAFSGHKGTFGPMGTGVLYVRHGAVKLKPFVYGGTGSRSYDLRQPENFPDVLEAGTQNVHGLAGLTAGIQYVLEAGVDKIHAHDSRLAGIFINEVLKMPGAVVYRADCERTGTVAVNFKDISSADLCEALGESGVCVRGGAHCAPLAHRALGTEKTGAVRFSFGFNTTEEDVRQGLAILKALTAR